jgi:hypothetical protein
MAMVLWVGTLCVTGLMSGRVLARAGVDDCSPRGTHVLLRTQRESIYRSSTSTPGTWTYFACRPGLRVRVPLDFAPVGSRAIGAVKLRFAAVAVVDDEIEATTSTVSVGSFQTGKLVRSYHEGTGDCRYDTSGRCSSVSVRITRLVLSSTGVAAWLASASVAEGSSTTSMRLVEALTAAGHRVLANSLGVAGTFLRVHGRWVYWRDSGITHRARLG